MSIRRILPSAVAIVLMLGTSHAHAQGEPPLNAADPRPKPLTGVDAICANSDAVSQSAMTDLGELGEIPSVDQLMLDVTARDAAYKAQSIEPRNGGLNPDYVRTEDELRRIAHKERQALIAWNCRQLSAHAPTTSGSPITNYPDYWLWLNVGYYPEPNDWAYRNYCGPASTQVALSARLPASQIPNIDTIGAEEGINPNWGVYMTAVRDVLNRRLGTTFYVANGAGNATNFRNRISADLSSGYALVTGLKTGGMSGWTRDVDHIVTIYAMYTGYPNPIAFTETSSPVAGYSGSYWRSESSAFDFYNWFVSRNDVQAW